MRYWADRLRQRPYAPPSTYAPPRRSSSPTLSRFRSSIPPVIDRRGRVRFRLELIKTRLANFTHIRSEILETVNPLIEPRDNFRMVLGKLVPGEISFIVTIVIALNIRGMRTVGFVHHGIDNQSWDQGAVRIRTNNCFVDDFFDHNDHMLGGERHFFLHTDQAPDLSVAAAVRTLRMENRDVRAQRRHNRDFPRAVRIIDQFDQRIRP